MTDEKFDKLVHHQILKEHSSEEENRRNAKKLVGASMKDKQRSKMLAIYKILKDGDDRKKDYNILEVRTEGIIVCNP